MIIKFSNIFNNPSVMLYRNISDHDNHNKKQLIYSMQYNRWTNVIMYASHLPFLQLRNFPIFNGQSIFQLVIQLSKFCCFTNTRRYITLHYITLHYITLHYITLHYITLHYITLHYITSTHFPIYILLIQCDAISSSDLPIYLLT